MNQSKFSTDQIKVLLSNPNVTKCSNKAISYNKEFKIMAVKQYNEEGKTANQIFREARFDLNIISKDTPPRVFKALAKDIQNKGSW